jgi:hypothetical protein
MSDEAVGQALDQEDCVDDLPAVWAAEDDYRMLSMAFTFRSARADVADALRWHLEPFLLAGRPTYGFPIDLYVPEEDRGADPPVYSYFVTGDPQFRSEFPLELLVHAIWSTHAEVNRRVRDFLLLHAGSVTHRGGALLLPGQMEAGKSSLTLALLEAGCGYLSDELGVLDPVTAHAYPFPKRIKLLPDALGFFDGLEDRLADREGLSRHLTERFVRPEDVGTGVAPPAAVRWLVFPTAEWEGPPQLTPVSTSEAIELMARSSMNLYRYGDRGVVLLSRIAKEATAFRLAGGSPRERAALLVDRLG